jgi:formamidopyrimidine-DNA glycosylase
MLRAELPLELKKVDSRGKFMYLVFDGDYSIGASLGLYGGWLYKESRGDVVHGLGIRGTDDDRSKKYLKRALKHRNVRLRFDRGDLYLYDQLSFGTLSIYRSRDELLKRLERIGPDVMNPTTTFPIFSERLRMKTNLEKAIGNVIMNQRVVSGIGNYLRADILWLARVSPFRAVDSLTSRELRRLWHSCQVLTWGVYSRKRAIRWRIIRDQDRTPADYGRHFFVYRCREDPDGKVVVKEPLYEGSQKRYIYWVPERQK